MYELVADVEKYPQFLPWCAALRIASKTNNSEIFYITADMVVAYKVFREKFRSRIKLLPTEKMICVEYIDGPFKNLQNRWKFMDIGEKDRQDNGAQIDFEIEFEFRNVFLQKTAQSVFDRVFSRMSDAFIDRAHVLYGP